MKKKIFSIVTCLMLCFTAMFMMTGCKEYDKQSIGETEAMTAMATAMDAMKTETVISMSGGLEGYMQMEMIVTETKVYANVDIEIFNTTSESWTIKEGDIWVEYMKTTYTYEEEGQDPVTETSYTKDIETDFEDPKDEVWDESIGEDFGEFAKAYIKDGETVIVFDQYDEDIDETTKLTIVIKDGKIREIKAGSGMMAVTFEFKYGTEIIETIPELPSPEGGWQDEDVID